MSRDPNMGRDGAKNGSRADPVGTVSCCPKTRQNSVYGILILSMSYDIKVRFKYQTPCGMI